MQGSAVLALVASSVLVLGCAVDVDDAPTPDAVGVAAQADHGGDAPFDVDFAGCREVANVTLVPTANARPLVPAQFTLAGDGTPTTPFVVRTVHCTGISTDGKKGKAGDLVQIGLVIVPPDGDGDINNYTLYYDTTDAKLADELHDVGVPARFAPLLDESLAVHPDGSGQYHFSAPIDPRFSFDGPVGAPATTPIHFTANWWSSSDKGTVKMASSFPQLFAADNGVNFTVPALSPLAHLIGATTVISWPVLKLFDHFPTAHMHVTVR
jgi:hypothetical protein